MVEKNIFDKIGLTGLFLIFLRIFIFLFGIPANVFNYLEWLLRTSIQNKELDTERLKEHV